MKPSESFLNRLLPPSSPALRAQRLRLLLLTGLVVAAGQLADPLQGDGMLPAFLFWSARISAFVISVLLAQALVRAALSGRLERPPWLKPAVVTMLIAVVPLTAAEVALEQWFPQQPDYDDSELMAASVLAAFVAEYLTIASILVPLSLLLWVLIDQRLLTEAPSPESREPYPEPAFLAKAGGVQAASVLALEASEHYVQVHTYDRKYLIHHRLRDAIEDMPESLGIQVHRSWWVARSAVVHQRRERRRKLLVLANGTEVPVSDSYAARARESGLLH